MFVVDCETALKNTIHQQEKKLKKRGKGLKRSESGPKR